MRAGILDLSFSIPVLLIVILLSTLGFSVWFRYDRRIEISSEEAETVDRFQYLMERSGYSDPCSGNVYPIMTLSSRVDVSFLFRIASRNAEEHDYIYLFPVYLFFDGRFETTFLGVGEEDACLLVCC
jgi:hypothetical protein